MARDEAPPFSRGETFYNGSTKDSVFSDPLNYLGKEYVFEVNAQDQSTGYPTATDNSGRAVRVRVAQNKSGGALKPARIARYKVAAPLETLVDGYAYQATDILAGVIDEFLPAAGVADGDLFFLVVDGPTQVESIHATDPTIAVGDRLENANAGSSATDNVAGRVAAFAGSPTVADALNLVGRADAACTAKDTIFAAVVHFSGRR